MIMKLLDYSIDNPKRLFVPVNEFEFDGFAVRVRHFASRQSKPSPTALRLRQRRSRSAWPISPVLSAR
jgi:hypothetical protein